MADLVVENFRRDLNAEEEDLLASQLAASPDDAERFAALAEAEYKRFGLPEPGRRWRPAPSLLWGLGAAALVAGWAAWPASEAAVPRVAVIETPYRHVEAAPGESSESERPGSARELGAEPASDRSGAPRADRLTLENVPGENASLLARVWLPAASVVAVDLKSADGKLVRHLYAGELRAGAHRLPVRGLSAGGRYEVVLITERGEQRQWAQVEWR